MIRFNTIIVLFLMTATLTSQAQNISATYAIEKNVEAMTINEKKTITLNMTGHFYKKKNKYIYWESADYLAKYPTGKISASMDNKTYTYMLNTDTMQTLYYHDYDSLIMKWGLLNRSQEAVVTYTFAADRSWPWEYQKETKTINGMKCQLATDKAWRVWFCPDIPTKTSLQSLEGLPGLVVEADCLPLKEHFILLNYSTPAKVNNDVFNPAVKQPIINGGFLPNIKAHREKTKQEKLQELLKQ